MLNAEWAKSVLPPPGLVLVVRDIPAVQKSGLYIPDSYRNQIRMCLATVIVGEGFNAGDRVMLESSAGNPILFGYSKDDEREMWVVEPEAILVRFHDSVSEATDMGSHFLRNMKDIAALEANLDRRWDEGDRQGPR